MNKEAFDFENILGGCDLDALRLSEGWHNVNLANANSREGQELAKEYIEFHKRLLKKEHMDGLLEPNATYANERALEFARDSKRLKQAITSIGSVKSRRKNRVLCTNLSHMSIENACHRLGLDKPIVLEAVPEKGYQVDEDELRRVISRYGNNIVAVVSTHGTTQLGHIENLAESDLVKQLREDGAWLHIDGAYGGYISQLSTRMYLTFEENRSIPINAGDTSRFSSRIKDFPEADSITIDSYKFIGKAGTSLLLVDERKKPRYPSAPYYDQSPFTMLSTLPADAIAAWYHTMKNLGKEQGLKEMADEYVYLTKITANSIKQQTPLSLVISPQMNIIPVDCVNERISLYFRKALNEKGFRVGRLNIVGRDYQTHGLRIVISPKVEYQNIASSAKRLVTTINELYG
ncbi:MAG: pyridoxal-dependent decarboxylase [Candidatus Woesearchaeota archaeon]